MRVAWSARLGRGAARGLVALLPLAMIAACGGNRSDSAAGDAPPQSGDVVVADQACLPVALALAPNASLARMPGTYSLTLEAPGTPSTSSRGTLSLTPRPEALREMAGADTPLGGTADIAVETVGALRLGDLGSTDPAAPGVLVIETDGPSVILRFGSDANRRDRVAFDGGFTVLTVHRIGPDGFDGSWRSGTRDGVNDGHFCARRSGG